MRYRLGTMGYSYPDWQGPFYPAGMGQGKWLSEYAAHFDAVELNTTFHAAPTVDRIKGWCAKVGPGFSFTVKTPRAITHDAPLSAAISPMRDFVQTAAAFGDMLGPIVLQLPPHVSIDAFRDLDKLLASLPREMRFAVEFREISWVVDRTTDLLREHHVAWVGLDHLDHQPLRRMRPTTDFLYMRLVGRHGRFNYLGKEQVDVTSELQKWHAAIVRESENSGNEIRDVWLIAGNDYAGFAPGTLEKFAKIAAIDITTAPNQLGLFSSD